MEFVEVGGGNGLEKVCVLRLDLRSDARPLLRPSYRKKLEKELIGILWLIDTAFKRPILIRFSRKLESWQIYLVPKNKKINKEKLAFEAEILRRELKRDGWVIDKWRDVQFTESAFLKKNSILANNWESLCAYLPRRPSKAEVRGKKRRGDELSRREYDILYKKEWRALRKRILKRDNYQFRLCGRPQGNTQWDVLHVHHIVPLVDREDYKKPLNLITLCKRCHFSLVGDVDLTYRVKPKKR